MLQFVELIDDELGAAWVQKHFHPHGLKCPQCQAGVDDGREFRTTKTSGLTVYRGRRCGGTYNLYSGTVFEGCRLRPAQVVLLLRGLCKGECATVLARELGLNCQTVHALRRRLQANGKRLQPDPPLSDARPETDELFQNAGKKVTGTAIRRARLAVEPTSHAATAPMIMTGHPWWDRSGATRGKFDGVS